MEIGVTPVTRHRNIPPGFEKNRRRVECFRTTHIARDFRGNGARPHFRGPGRYWADFGGREWVSHRAFSQGPAALAASPSRHPPSRGSAMGPRGMAILFSTYISMDCFLSRIRDSHRGQPSPARLHLERSVTDHPLTDGAVTAAECFRDPHAARSAPPFPNCRRRAQPVARSRAPSLADPSAGSRAAGRYGFRSIGPLTCNIMLACHR